MSPSESRFDDIRLFFLRPKGPSYHAAAIVEAYASGARATQEKAREADPLLADPQGNGFAIRTYHNLQKFVPHEMAAIGFPSVRLPRRTLERLKPAVRVAMCLDIPRAYEEFPLTYSLLRPVGQRISRSFYVVSPRGYNGHAFIPLSSEELAGSAKLDVLGHIYGEDSPLELPILKLPARGVETPADFDPKRHFAYPDHGAGITFSVFLAQGRSQKIIDGFLAERAARSDEGTLFSYPLGLDRKGYYDLQSAFKAPAEAASGSVRLGPDFEVHAGRVLIVYRHRADWPIPAPQDSIPISSRLYRCLERDSMDRQGGVVPPPMPAPLVTEYNRVFPLAALLPRTAPAGPVPGLSS